MNSLSTTKSASRLLGLLSVLLLFVGCIGFGYCWINLNNEPSAEGVWFSATTNIVSYQFIHEELSDFADEKLQTSSYINGQFKAEEGGVVAVFNGNWVGTKRGLRVIQHTPDICWAQAGWKPARLDAVPRQITLVLPKSGGNEAGPNAGQSGSDTIGVPFECRVFEAPSSTYREIVVWSTALGGQIIPEAPSWLADEALPQLIPHGQITGPITRTKLAIHRFIMSVQKKFPARGTKQFVRISVPLKGDVETSLERIREFAKAWLTISPISIIQG